MLEVHVIMINSRHGRSRYDYFNLETYEFLRSYLPEHIQRTEVEQRPKQQQTTATTTTKTPKFSPLGKEKQDPQSNP